MTDTGAEEDPSPEAQTAQGDYPGDELHYEDGEWYVELEDGTLIPVDDGLVSFLEPGGSFGPGPSGSANDTPVDIFLLFAVALGVAAFGLFKEMVGKTPTRQRRRAGGSPSSTTDSGPPAIGRPTFDFPHPPAAEDSGPFVKSPIWDGLGNPFDHPVGDLDDLNDDVEHNDDAASE